jgi:type IV secretory pathway protease TraF
VNRVAACVVAVLCGIAALAPPRQYEVDGLSMAPGLRARDVVTTSWFPSLDRLRQPRRHERWILTSPDGSPAIKRVVGLPGETISIRGGDLTIGGQTVLTPPSLLAELASAVPEAALVQTEEAAAHGVWQRSLSLLDVFDDADFAPEERRMLLPVRDVGLAAVIHLRGLPSEDLTVRVLVRVGDVVLPWRIKTSGRYAVVAGRLDGRLVGGAWPITADAVWPANARHALPPQAPAAWDVAQPWLDRYPSDAESGSLALSIGFTANGLPMHRAAADGMLERLVVWRDIFHRPTADGVVEWRLESNAFFVLGDFPSGSRDSRHWGPLSRRMLRSRAQPLD